VKPSSKTFPVSLKSSGLPDILEYIERMDGNLDFCEKERWSARDSTGENLTPIRGLILDVSSPSNFSRWSKLNPAINTHFGESEKWSSIPQHVQTINRIVVSAYKIQFCYLLTCVLFQGVVMLNIIGPELDR